MSRRTVRKNGKPLTPTEHQRRWRAKKKARLKAQREAERRCKRVEVTKQLGIMPRAISDISEADLASNSVDAVVTDPPYADDRFLLDLASALAHSPNQPVTDLDVRIAIRQLLGVVPIKDIVRMEAAHVES